MAGHENTNLTNWAVREVAPLFGALRRYTRFVFFSKWFLGVFAIVLMTSLIAWPLLSKDKSGIRITFTGTDKAVSNAASPVMNNPVYQGNDVNGQQYKITGLRAVQKTPELITIEKIEGQLLRADGSFVGLTADEADYRQKSANLDLRGNVNVSDSAGYVFVTPSATVDTNTMVVTGNEAIEGTGPQGNILATGFKIEDNGKRITFGQTGRVTVHLEKMRK